jgi:hypothetical protein
MKQPINSEFAEYLILVGIRSLEYAYSNEILFENIDYFKRSHDNGLSPYKALLFLRDYVNGDYNI